MLKWFHNCGSLFSSRTAGYRCFLKLLSRMMYSKDICCAGVLIVLAIRILSLLKRFVYTFGCEVVLVAVCVASLVAVSLLSQWLLSLLRAYALGTQACRCSSAGEHLCLTGPGALASGCGTWTVAPWHVGRSQTRDRISVLLHCKADRIYYF